MTLSCWLSTSLRRIYPQTPPPRKGVFALQIARNECCSAQVVLRHKGREPFRVSVTATAPDGWEIRIRRVGYVPIPHFNTPIESRDADLEGRAYLPGLAPDPLFEETAMLLPGRETHAFWLSLRPGGKIRPGIYRIRIHVHPEPGHGAKVELVLSVKVCQAEIPPRRNFFVTNWFYLDCLMAQHRTDFFDRRFWRILPAYFANMRAHGQDAVYTSIFSVGLDGDRAPSQLLHISETAPGRYRFDWRDVQRFVRLARQQGIERFEWSHFFSQWGVKHAPRLYHGQGKDERLLWRQSTGATAPAYRNFLAQFLPSFHRFLNAEELLDCSIFHLSDEPGADALESYGKARALLRELAPWIKVHDALSHKEFAVRGLTDVPVPSINVAPDFVRSGIDCGCYFCCGPRGGFLNRLMDTPLAKIRMSGWLFYRWPFKGFLHWGYNYWNRAQKREPIDPFALTDAGAYPNWAYGDPFVVYPGADGPLDSIRWEIFAESLQDYALLQGLDIDRDGSLLAPFRSFEDFPKNDRWLSRARQRLLTS